MDLDAIVFVEGGSIDQRLLQQAFDEVLRPAFVTDELPGPATVIDPVSGAPAQDVLVALVGGHPVGIGVHDEMHGGIALLSYLAVREDVRSAGVGGRLLARLREVWANAGVDLVLGEIHDPRGHVESVSERPADRLAFYHQHGATLLGPWIQPALAGGGRRVSDMLLIVLHQGENGLQSSSIEGASVVAWAERYFAEEEGAVPSDAGYLELIARYREVAAIDPVSLDHYTAVPPFDSSS